MHFAFVALAAVATVLAQPTNSNAPLFNPLAPLSNATGIGAAPATPNSPATNAKRFEHGLPPLKPRSHRHHSGPKGKLGVLKLCFNYVNYDALPAGTRVRSAPRAQTSPTPPIQVSCNILAYSTSSTVNRYVSPTWNEYGEYHEFQDTQEGALVVSFSYPEGNDSPSQISLHADNGPSEAYPYFGGVVGFGSQDDDFGPGASYAYLAGTTATPPGSPAIAGPNSFTAASGYEKNIETAIWRYSPVTQELYYEWINSVYPPGTYHIIYFNGVLALTGDPLAISYTFGPFELLRFKCVPPPTSAAA